MLVKSTTESLFGLCSLSKNYVERTSGNKNYSHLLTYFADADYVKKCPKKTKQTKNSLVLNKRKSIISENFKECCIFFVWSSVASYLYWKKHLRWQKNSQAFPF